MKTYPPALAAHIAGGATTLAHCWRIERADGTVLGFTDHDRPIAFDALVYEPATGLSAAGFEAALGFRASVWTLEGALDAAGIAAADIADGRYDGAAVETWLVNWAGPDERAVVHVGTIGAVTQADGAFRVTVAGRLAEFDVVTGRLFQPPCDAELGDARCGVDAGDPAFAGAGTVVSSDGARFVVDGLEAFAGDWFSLGVLTWSDGPLAGLGAVVAEHRVAAGLVTLALRLPPSRTIPEGTAFAVVAGCDKRFATCREKFANVVNFRGFPHMPGNDFLVAAGGGAEG